MRARGPQSQKLFWNFVGGSKKPKLGIESLEYHGQIVSDSDGKAKLVEAFFIKKFKASLKPSAERSPLDPPLEEEEDEALKERLGVPNRPLKPEDINNLN